MGLKVIILAAGIGKRMFSKQSKMLHTVAGKPLLEHVFNTSRQLNPEHIYIVYGPHNRDMLDRFSDWKAEWVEQKEPKGTGHAVQQVLPKLSQNDRVLILCGDAPLIEFETLQKFIEVIREDTIGCLTAFVKNPFSFGRIVRDSRGNFRAVVEEKDATRDEKRIHEVNAGVYFMPAKYLKEWLPALDNQNVQHEYYLPDILRIATEKHIKVYTFEVRSAHEIEGVNDKEQLAKVERFWQKENAKKYMRQGLTLIDPDRFDVRGELAFGQDTVIDVNVVIEGKVKIGSDCHIGANTILKNAIIGDRVTIKPYTLIEDAVIEAEAEIGPFARIRPETHIRSHAKIGNFVEIKKSTIGEHSKVNHLSYVGDAEIHEKVNVGAGTITCNYDGAHKHKTVIEAEAFIGSNTSLVAPVTIGAGATIGAGSTITMDAPKDKLTLARSKQTIIEGWQRPKKDKK